MSIRREKIEHLIKEELSLIFLHKLQDPEFGLTTITSVKVSPDVRIAKVYFSVFNKENREMMLNKVNELSGFIRGQLAQKVKLRHTPELHFYIDDTIDYVEKMENIFKKLQNDDKQSDE
ncbi:MAG: 30S ribosome-binding factor RbfA [Melioribacteraceae bacterium]|nr:30S ribosome-binding factor RbfA [Melioribacteraceae bacterium]